MNRKLRLRLDISFKCSKCVELFPAWRRPAACASYHCTNIKRAGDLLENINKKSLQSFVAVLVDGAGVLILIYNCIYLIAYVKTFTIYPGHSLCAVF